MTASDPTSWPRRACCTLTATIALLQPIDGRAQSPAAAAAAAPRSLRAAAAGVPIPPQPAAGQPFSGMLTLRDAVRRGIDYNLAVTGVAAEADRARADASAARGALRPNLSGEASILSQRVNLAAMGVSFDVPTVDVPTVVGPFRVLDARVRLTQTLYDRPAIESVRAAESAMRAAALATDDARNQIVLMVGSAYLDAVAARARLQLARATAATAAAVQQKTERQQTAGLATPLEVSGARIDALNARQQAVTLEAEMVKAKIELARMIGVSPGAEYDLSPEVAYAAAPPITLEDALAEAAARPDVSAAAEQLASAERSLDAAHAARLPSAMVMADVGSSQAMSEPARGTYSVAGVLRVPIWQGGRVAARVGQASAAVSERRARLEDVKARAEAEIRRIYVDLGAADGRVSVARDSVGVTRETLAYVQQRFDNGLAEDVDLARARQSVAAAEFELTSAVLAHDTAKLALARALGRASGDLARFLLMP